MELCTLSASDYKRSYSVSDEMRYTWQAAAAIIQMFPINHLFFKTVTMCQQNMDFLIVMDTRLSKLRKREETFNHVLQVWQ